MKPADSPPAARHLRRPAAQAALAGLATGLATLVCMGLDAHMSVAALALVYLVAVLVTAALLERWAAVLTSVASVSALNYFFVPPRHSFQVDGPEYLLTLAILLAVSLSINSLVASLRARRAQAERRARQAGELHELSEQLAEGQGPRAVAQAAAHWLATRLGRPCAVFLQADDPPGGPPALPRGTGAQARGLLCLAAPQAAGGAEAGPAFHAAAAAWAMEQRRPVGRGCPDWPQLALWCAPFAGTQPGGAVQVLLADAARPDAETLAHWLALARQVGLSVERERAAAAARTAQDSAQSEATRNALLASLSHDLRTPLAGILGSASALREQGGAMPAVQRERLLANLEDEAQDMTLMVDNILQMARLSQAQCRIRLQWESLEEIVGVAVQRLRRRWPAARIHWRVGRRLPPILAEAGLLAQVLANLVDNAVRHSGGQAEVLIRAGRTRSGLFLAVRDHGPGLPEGDPQTLFERFHQGAMSAHGDAGAAGLGLSLCQTIVQAHGGQIAALRCAPGAEFRIELPAAAAVKETGHA
ncbi:DUF4118 domain-containing protein [Ramlibacter sp. 2FC]|uniref:DUF4118 domain-containing protein n=1 Tax=Ramlibacter sp. 2FC TaxID=2502188 RepID=UPI0010F6369D|nr:DUF4118 domain-containing protein [Ramlibacter sp. 2FC]